MLNKPQLRELLAEPGLNKTDRLLLLLAIEVEKPKSAQALRHAAVECGSPELLDANVSAFLSAARPKATKLPSGWILTAKGKEYVKSNFLGPKTSPKENLFDPVDRQIISVLQLKVPTAALSYEQAIRDLEDSKRLSFRGPATDMREALRETLDNLAPDSAVTSMVGYKQEPTAIGPTMKQKVRYILKSRGKSGAHTDPVENATTTVDEIVGAFVRSVYTRSNVSTHTATDRNEVLRLRHFVRISLMEILEIHS